MENGILVKRMDLFCALFVLIITKTGKDYARSGLFGHHEMF